MEKTRKNLKIISIVVLVLAGLSLLNIILELFFGELNGALNDAAISEGFSENIILITKIIIVVVSVLVLLPQAYIGIKGIKIANKPDSSKGHIVWGIILMVLTALGLISPFLALIQGNGDVLGNIASLCSTVVDVVIFFEYVNYAKVIRDRI